MARKDKIIAFKLRRSGKSYRLISKKLGIPKSTLSDWFASSDWSVNIRDRLRKNSASNTLRIETWVKNNRTRWEAWREKYKIEATREYTLLKNNPLFAAGLMLYWGEGDNSLKRPNSRLTNTDPEMIKVFLRFAEKICKVKREDVRIGLILYSDLSETANKIFWSKYLNIPLNQFHKTQFIQGSHPTKRLEHGICMIRIGGVGLKEKINAWRGLYIKDLMRV